MYHLTREIQAHSPGLAVVPHGAAHCANSSYSFDSGKHYRSGYDRTKLPADISQPQLWTMAQLILKNTFYEKASIRVPPTQTALRRFLLHQCRGRGPFLTQCREATRRTDCCSYLTHDRLNSATHTCHPHRYTALAIPGLVPATKPPLWVYTAALPEDGVSITERLLQWDWFF